MLLNNLFIPKSISTQPENDKTRVDAWFTINKDHEIFSGHFPGLPIVPGVCMVQLIKELMEVQLEKKLMLQDSGNIKFLSMINPQVNSEVKAIVRFAATDSVEAEGELYFDSVVFFKMKGVFVNDVA